jgi:endoplasmic reticulum-Golgi intermediate compartment protein 2
MGYAIRITYHAVEVVTGADQTQGTIAAEATGVRPGGFRSKFSGAQIHSRKSSLGLGRVIRQGNGWVVENPGGGPPSFGTPVSGAFTPSVGSRPSSMYGGGVGPPYSPYSAAPSPNLAPPSINGAGSVLPGSPALPPGVGLGLNSPAFGQQQQQPHAAFLAPGTPYMPTTPTMPLLPPPRSPSRGHVHFPSTSNPATGNGAGFPPPPPSERKSSSGNGNGKKDE